MGRIISHGSWGKVKCGVTIFFTLLAIANVLSQPLTVNEFLKSALDDPYYKSFDLQDAYLSRPGNFRLPWLEELQFRYRDSEFQNIEQRYAFRVEPGNPWQISQNRKYFQGVKALKTIEQKLILKEDLKERYYLVVEYWTASEQANLVEKQKNSREQIGNALAQKSGSSGFDADQYLNSQIDIISKGADWHEAILDRDVALVKILSGTVRSSFEFQDSDFISIDRINQFIQSEQNLVNKTELDFLKQEISLSGQKIKLEKTNIDMGFLQAMYTDRENKSRSPMGVALGINIPLFNNSRDDMAREKLNQMERQGELETFQLDENRKLVSTLTGLNLHFLHYQKLDSLVRGFQSRGLNALTGMANNYDPLVELKYQEKLVQFDILKLKIKKEILVLYINWLDHTDKLQQRPLTNYLSKDLMVLEN